MATQTFSETLVKNETVIKPVHLEELQDAINTWQAAYAISETGWQADDAKDVKMKASQMEDMQNALDALKTILGEGNFSWSYPAVKGDIARATVPTEIRDNINYIQDGKCYLCHTCDTESCTCNISCNNDGCDTCDSAFYPSCLCNTGCHNDSCDLCYSARYPACSCNTACNVDLCDRCGGQNAEVRQGGRGLPRGGPRGGALCAYRGRG